MNRLPRLLTAALVAADRGWPVFPVVPSGKRPAIRGWPLQATCDPARLTRWWRDAPYNIGIACGPAELLVLDLDRPNINQVPPDDWVNAGVHNGQDVIALLARRAGHPDPSSTYTVATPSGEHRYFVATAGARSTAGRLGWLVDTRGVGGYVLAAGSVRHLDGRRRYYHRIGSPHTEPAPAPSWLLDALTPPLEDRARRPEPPQHRDAYVRAALAAESDRVRHATVGTRNTTVFHAARRLGRFVAAGLLDQHDITAALTNAAIHFIGADGFTDAEAATTISNGLRYGHRHSRH